MLSGVSSVSWPGWDVVRKIGSGSFGAVYEIQRKICGKVEHAALKIITIPSSNNEILELQADGYDEEGITNYFADSLSEIQNEYATMAEMKGHANVVYCDDIRTVQHDKGFGWDVYIKMELLTPLKSYLVTSVTEKQIIKIGLDICNALMLCQQLNIIHRDIKPENIFVSRVGNYKLGDFGIAKTMEGTSYGTKTGTYEYMAPEVYNNRPYHLSADIYSLGLVLYWLLNERKGPFLDAGKPTLTEKMVARSRRFSGEPIPAPKNGSAALKAVVLKACEFESQNRFLTAKEMYDALSRCTQSLPEADDIEDDEEPTIRKGSAEKSKEKKDLFIGQIIGDSTHRYQVLAVLSEDEVTKTYLVMTEREHVQHQYAMQVLDKMNNHELRDMLYKEARMLYKLHHPSIPAVIQVMESKEHFFVVRENIAGEDLESKLKREGAQSPENVVNWAVQLCDVLGYLHEQQPPYIYRDMKPANIMLLGNGRLMLRNFGAMQMYEPSKIKDDVRLGTKGYAAPEQLYNTGPSDARTDIYTLGMTMYALLAGKNPVGDGYVRRPVRQFNPAVPPKLEAIIQKCTELERKNRYQSCAELKADLKLWWKRMGISN